MHSATDAPQAKELVDKITAQGTKVRELKTANADQAAVDKEVSDRFQRSSPGEDVTDLIEFDLTGELPSPITHFRPPTCTCTHTRTHTLAHG